LFIIHPVESISNDLEPEFCALSAYGPEKSFGYFLFVSNEIIFEKSKKN